MARGWNHLEVAYSNVSYLDWNDLKIGLSWAVDQITYTRLLCLAWQSGFKKDSPHRSIRGWAFQEMQKLPSLLGPRLRSHTASLPLYFIGQRNHKPVQMQGEETQSLSSRRGKEITLQKSIGNEKYYWDHLWNIQPDTRLFLSKLTLNLLWREKLLLLLFKHFKFLCINILCTFLPQLNTNKSLRAQPKLHLFYPILRKLSPMSI